MKEKVKATIKHLTDLLSGEAVDVDVHDAGGVLKIQLHTADEKTFIGKDNEKFEALSHLLKKIIAKDLGEDIKIVVDINDLRNKNDEALKVRANILADRARSFKTDVEFPLMTSYERRVVHSTLEGSPMIKTESIGEGKERRLIIRFIGENQTSN